MGFKKLFAFDLDGTLLANSSENSIPKDVKKTIKWLKNAGHIVCIFTGRPWRATRQIYKDLELETVVVNYNGAFIHNPSDYNFLPQIERIKMIDVIKVIEDKRLQKIANNIAIEGPNYIAIKDSSSSPFRETFIKDDGSVKIIDEIDWKKIKDEPTGVLIEVKKEYSESIHMIKNWFDSRYGDLGEFSYWDAGNGHNPILEFTNISSRKDIALRKVSRYYKIDMSDTIAFGDGFNDVEMLKAAGVGVAMANASNIVKSYANVVSKKTNKEGGVAHFVDWYLKEGHLEIEKTLFDFSIGNTHEIQLIEDTGNVYKKQKRK